MVNYWFGPDDELDAALILAGVEPQVPKGRYCFQTTYLNENVSEYYEHQNDHKIIWVLRNPYSVIYSMLHNWKKFALNELFESCALQLLSEREKRLYQLFGVRAFSRLRRACLAYNAKTSQIFELNNNLVKNAIIVVDYDNLVKKRKKILPLIYDFIELNYKTEYSFKINKDSLEKSNFLSKQHSALIEETCLSVYQRAQRLIHYS